MNKTSKTDLPDQVASLINHKIAVPKLFAAYTKASSYLGQMDYLLL